MARRITPLACIVSADDAYRSLPRIPGVRSQERSCNIVSRHIVGKAGTAEGLVEILGSHMCGDC